MSNRKITKLLNYQKAVSIVESLKAFAATSVKEKDGVNKFGQVENQADKSGPIDYTEKIDIPLTTTSFDVTQMGDSFLQIELELTLSFNIDLANSDVAKAYREGMFLWFGLKSSNQIFREYSFYRRGQQIGKSLQNRATIEGFCTSVFKPKSEKNNRIFCHSLFENVSAFEPSMCGVYVSYQQIKANTPIAVKFPVCIPYEDILAISDIRDFPTFLFDELKLQFSLNPNAIVYTWVNPSESITKYFGKKHNYGFGGPAQDEAKVKLWQWQKIVRDSCLVDPLPLSHEFYQIGEKSTVPYDFTALINEGNTDIVVNKQIIPNVIGCRALSTKCIASGYNVHPAYKEHLRKFFYDYPFVVFGQRIDSKPFTNAATDMGLNSELNIPVTLCTDMYVLFPTKATQQTVYPNPQLQGVQLNMDNVAYPGKALSTTSHTTFTMTLNSADLGSSMYEATEELENSLITPRSDNIGLIYPLTDCTSFLLPIQLERSNCGTAQFDGVHSDGKNFSINLVGTPQLQGIRKDIYYYVPTFNSPSEFTYSPPPPPVLCMMQNTFWVFTTRNGGEVTYYTDKEYEKVIAEQFPAVAKDLLTE